MSWLDGLVRHRRLGTSCVVVTIESVRGSAPRGVGTRMTVGVVDFDGTIGGGALERAALEHARTLIRASGREDARWERPGIRIASGGDGGDVVHDLDGDLDGDGSGRGRDDGDIEPAASHDPAAASSLATFPLARALSQCCGGEVTLRFEPHPGVDFRVEVFGAGHVAQELARLLVRLPCRATFHDPREEWLARLGTIDGADALGTRLLGENVHGAVEAGPADAYWLVMTHSHELDLDVVEAVLSRGDSRYCGLIASGSKAASFRGRLSRKGFSDEEVRRLTAPLGQRVETGNTPMEVAVAAVADVLSARAAVGAYAAGDVSGGAGPDAESDPVPGRGLDPESGAR